MQPSRTFSGLKNAGSRLLFFGVLAFIISFDTQPGKTYYGDGASRLALNVRASEEVKRFMSAASDSVLTILNGNLWMLPGGLSTEKEARLEQFIAYARQLMPHVITLQEIWTTDLVAYLTVRFPEFRVVASGATGLVNQAGLVTLTRVPSDSSAFAAFAVAEDASLVEKQARKGYLTLRMKTPVFNTCIVNTHLYAPTRPEEQALVAEQFNALKNLETSNYTFIVGDLNLPQRAFERLNASFFLTEEDTLYTVDPANKYRSRGANALNSKRVDRYKIDRLLMPQAHAEHFTLKSMLIREPVVSDHYLLAYRIERH